MDISTGTLIIEAKHDMTLNSDTIEIISVAIDGIVIFKYKLNNVINYYQYYVTAKMQQYLFFELLNKSQLYSIVYNINPYRINFMAINFTININSHLILDYVDISLSLNYIIKEIFNKSKNYVDTDFVNTSIIPYSKPYKPANFNIQLYEYQQKSLSKMLLIEKGTFDFSVKYTNIINIKDVEINFDPIKMSHLANNKEHNFKITTKGGILADEMGLGKTITSIALIVSNPAPKDLPNVTNNKINSRATLILCPSHLIKQWKSEIVRCNKDLIVLTILTKNDYAKITFDNFINADIIITSHQFIMNFKFYPSLYYRDCTPSNMNFDDRLVLIKQTLLDKLSTLDFESVKKLEQPIFEFFNFHRFILDEGHEIFSSLLSTHAINYYMIRWVTNISVNYYWYISGTPFINYGGIKNCAKFINLKLEDLERNLVIDYTLKDNENKNVFLTKFMCKEYIWTNIFSKICIRHRKVDVENQIQIPGYEEKLVWLKFTELERQLYDVKKTKATPQYLQQLCCHPLIVESTKKIFGDVEVDLSLMQDKLIEYHKSNCISYKNKLEKLDTNNPAYYMLKKSFETQISESTFLITILEKMKSTEMIEQETCAICMDQLTNPTVTACGHLFCYECLKMCLGDKKRCPMCKKDLSGKDLLVTNLKAPEKTDENPLIKKYGSKLGKLISIIRYLVAQKETRIIIFSQWDDMLTLIGKTLAENQIENCFVKGHVWSRNAAISRFKAGKTAKGVDNKVIMLSLKNAASGTNLTEATHIFFVEPINTTHEESIAIESQAIARACRVGQKQKILLMRLLIEQTIEEEIYRRNYNNDVNVIFDENANYLLENNNLVTNVEEIIKPIKKVRQCKKVIVV